VARVEYQHYIGEGPEAQALIQDANDRYMAFMAAAEAFRVEMGFSGSWQKSNFTGPRICGPTYDLRLTKEEEAAHGLKYMGKVDGLHAYEPRLNFKAGKILQAKLDEVNKLAIDQARYVVKKSGMFHEVFVGMVLARSTCGFKDGVIFMRVPTGNGDVQNGGMPTPPAWLRPCKESEFLAAQGL